MSHDLATAAITYWCAAFVLVLTRISTFFVVFPLFRYGSVPRLIKVSLAISLSVTWLPGITTFAGGGLPSVADGAWLGFALALAREAAIGGALGYFFGLFLLPAEIAGAYIGQEMGLSMATIADPASGVSKNIVGDALGALALMIFFGNDIHHLVLGTLYASFTHRIDHIGLSQFDVTTFTGGLSNAERWGIELAAPVAVVLFLTTVLLTVMIRTSPQLNLFSVGTMLRVGIGLAATFVFLPDMAAMMAVVFSNVSSIVQHLGL